MAQRFRSLAVLLPLLLAGEAACSRPAQPRAAERVSSEVMGEPGERVAAVVKMLRLPPALAATVIDAHAVSERVGDGRLGPSDFSDFQLLRVTPANLAQWRAMLKPIEPPVYATPNVPMAWWAGGPEFASLEFFKGDALTGRQVSWVGIGAASGLIYIHSVTQ